MADDLQARNSFMGSVYCRAASHFVNHSDFTNSALNRVINDTLFPDAGGFKGSFLQLAAQGGTQKNFPDLCASTVAQYLVNEGKVAAVSRDMNSAVEAAFGGIAASSEAVNNARASARESFMALHLDVALA